MNADFIFKRLRKDLSSEGDVQERIKQRVTQRLSKPLLFAELQKQLTPQKSLKPRVWKRVVRTIDVPSIDTFKRIRVSLVPPEGLGIHIKQQILLRLVPVQEHVVSSARMLKWVAAFALFGLFVRMSPFVFIATPTVADSVVLLMPTRGEVTVSIDGMWHPVSEELALRPGMLLRTRDGEASIIFRDDGVIRLDANTTIELHDISDRLDPAPEVLPTLTLYTGKIWVQGLVPDRLRGITISTTYGLVTVNEGSVSVAEDDIVDIDIYDRRAVIQRNNQRVSLASGERMQLWENNILLVKKIPAKWYQRNWAAQNLERDAVHRQDIAQLQNERRIAQAGILPSSPLYPVKRLAEAVDVILTFGEEARMQKKLQVAETRLNEAAALLAEGSDASATLAEYRGAILQIASGSGDGSLAQFLIRQAIAETSAKVAAALPGDEVYPLKRTILETSTGLSDVFVQEVRGELLLDGLVSVMRKIDAGDTAGVHVVWAELQPYLMALNDHETTFAPVVRKEALVLLSFFSVALHEADRRGAAVDPELLDDVAMFLPPPIEPTNVALTEEEVMQIAQDIRGKIFIYDFQQSRINQLVAELRMLQGHPDKGRILRRLASVLPEGPENFSERVYKEIVRLRWETSAQATL